MISPHYLTTTCIQKHRWYKQKKNDVFDIKVGLSIHFSLIIKD